MGFYEARLVAKGYAWTYGLHYEENFSPMAKMSSIMFVISLIVSRNWKLYQMDVKNVFLNGKLIETVYVEQPQG